MKTFLTVTGVVVATILGLKALQKWAPTWSAKLGF